MTLVVLPAVRPSSIGNAPNGHISADALVNVGGASVRMLAVEAATQYVALRDACHVATGVFFVVMGGGAYRSYDEQVTLFGQRYTSPPRAGLPAASYRTWGGEKYSLNKGMASAASPGTSNHGYGIAVDIGIPVIDPNTGRTLKYTDIDESAAWPWLLEHAVAYGWSWEVQSENWHLRLVELPKDHRPAPAVPANPTAKGRRHMSHCKDALTGKFWFFGRDSAGAAYACPIDELPGKGDWDVYGVIENAVNGDLVAVDHAFLQAMYDKRGEPTDVPGGATGATGTAGPPGVKGDTGKTGADSTVPGPQGVPGGTALEDLRIVDTGSNG